MVVDIVGTGRVLVKNLDMGELEYLMFNLLDMGECKSSEYGKLLGFSRPDVSLLFEFDNLSQVVNTIKFICEACENAEFSIQDGLIA